MGWVGPKFGPDCASRKSLLSSKVNRNPDEKVASRKSFVDHRHYPKITITYRIQAPVALNLSFGASINVAAKSKKNFPLPGK
jgi:hypothetical protein